MRLSLLAALAVVSTAAMCPPPHPPTPPPPSQFRLQVYVHADDAASTPLTNARVYRDNVPAENPFQGGTPVPVGPDAGAAWLLPPQDFNVCGSAPGYTAECAPVPLHQAMTITIVVKKRPDPPPPPPVPDVPHHWTREQLRDFQGDLMIWAPEVGCAPEAKINCGPARGLTKGWVWSLTTPRYNAEHRAQLYAAAKRMGWTHYAIDVNGCEIGTGYHDLIPVTDCTGFDASINTVLRELHQQNLIPVCAGMAPGASIANIDRSLCPIAMDDWDNSGQLWGRLKATGDAFPNALLYIEVPYGLKVPEPSGGDEPVVPADGNGGAWIREAQRRYPNFVGVLHELDPDVEGQFEQNVHFLTDANPWYRDLQQVLFETDTYAKFWQDIDVTHARDLNDRLRSRAPWLQGYMSSATPHAAPIPTPSGDGHFDGELSMGQVTNANAPDFRTWPQTTELTRVEIGLDDLKVTFDKQASWPEVSFGIQYSLGLCLNRNGWVCSAPIELWKGKPGSGGAIQDQHLDCGKPAHGQVACNWFYDGRWGALRDQQPRTGEQIGVFVLAGDARNNISNPQERSNIVLVKLPADGASAVYVK